MKNKGEPRYRRKDAPERRERDSGGKTKSMPMVETESEHEGCGSLGNRTHCTDPAERRQPHAESDERPRNRKSGKSAATSKKEVGSDMSTTVKVRARRVGYHGRGTKKIPHRQGTGERKTCSGKKLF